MGGKSTNETPAVAAPTGFPGQPGTYQLPPAPPGILDQIAAAMAAGYGGGHKAQRAYLDQIYRPMSFQSFQPVGAQVSAPAPAANAGGLGAAKAPPQFGNIPYEQLISR